MTPDEHARVTEIFGAALERSPQEWAELIAAACSGNALILGEVNRLLLAHDRAGEFLNLPALPNGKVPTPVSEPERAAKAMAPPVSIVLTAGVLFRFCHSEERRVGKE